MKSVVATLKKPQGDLAFEEEKAWLDAELVDGGNAKGEPATMDDVDENVVPDNADDEEDDGTGIECQCCFADYPFVRAAIFSSFLSYPNHSLLPLSPKWFNAPKLTSFAQLASQLTQPHNWAPTTPL